MDLADNDPTLFQTWLGAGNTSNTIEIRQVKKQGQNRRGSIQRNTLTSMEYCKQKQKQEQQEHGFKKNI